MVTLFRQRKPPHGFQVLSTLYRPYIAGETQGLFEHLTIPKRSTIANYFQAVARLATSRCSACAKLEDLWWEWSAPHHILQPQPKTQEWSTKENQLTNAEKQQLLSRNSRVNGPDPPVRHKKVAKDRASMNRRLTSTSRPLAHRKSVTVMETVIEANTKSHTKLHPRKQTVTNLVPNVPIEDPLAAVSCGALPWSVQRTPPSRSKSAGPGWEEPPPSTGPGREQPESTRNCYRALALAFPSSSNGHGRMQHQALLHGIWRHTVHRKTPGT